MLWDPFLMKKLLKSEICEFVNSARKKKKKRNPQDKNADATIS